MDSCIPSEFFTSKLPGKPSHVWEPQNELTGTLIHMSSEAYITPWEVPDVSLHVISHWHPSPLISNSACQLAGRGLRPRARHTHQLEAGAAAETRPAVVCVVQPAPSGVRGSAQPQPFPGAAHGPGPGPLGLPARPQGPGPAATPRSSHPPGVTAPLTVGGRQAVRPCQPCSLPPALVPPARCPP